MGEIEIVLQQSWCTKHFPIILISCYVVLLTRGPSCSSKYISSSRMEVSPRRKFKGKNASGVIILSFSSSCWVKFASQLIQNSLAQSVIEYIVS
jgi:hypothetical protein